jgi:hypothetical protein
MTPSESSRLTSKESQTKGKTDFIRVIEVDPEGDLSVRQDPTPWNQRRGPRRGLISQVRSDSFGINVVDPEGVLDYSLQ